ncbi:MAG TPA: CsbD family protein [Actinomycetes bacterium]|nr:CsbD family protein [Actinomycetes bacterium]
MSKDETTGRIKEAAGDLSGDKGLQREGETEQAEGKVKDAVDSAADQAKDVVNRD